MAEFELKSYAFRKEREPGWQRLEELLGKAEARGVGALDTQELLRLPILYRATLSALSVARSISLDRSLLTYLEGLSGRAYFLVYGGRSNLIAFIKVFLARSLPRAVRGARWHIAISALALLLGTVAGYTLTLANPDWFYTFVGDSLAGNRTPTASTETLRDALFTDGRNFADRLTAFASFLFTHNARIGMLAFALGFIGGVPTIMLLITNGLMLGAFAGLYASRNLSYELWGWLMIHGGTELLAIILCGAAGLMLGGALIFPGEYTRMANLARAGRRAATIVMGAVILFFVAGLLEAFGRQLILDTVNRYSVAALMLGIWALYFVWAGRDRRG